MSNQFICAIFFITLLLHFCVISIMSIEREYNRYFGDYLQDYSQDYLQCRFINHNCCKNINISYLIDIKYVLIMIILITTNQPVLMCIVSSIMFANSYLNYMIRICKCTCPIDKNISLLLFLCIWISLYYTTIPNTFVPYLMMIGSGCVYSV